MLTILIGAATASCAPPEAVDAAECGPGGACDTSTASSLARVADDIGIGVLRQRGLAAHSAEIRVWQTVLPTASAGSVLRVVGDGPSLVAEAFEWYPAGTRDSSEVFGEGPPRREPVCPRAWRREARDVCPGPRRGVPYASNLRRYLDSLGVWRLTGSAAEGETRLWHNWHVPPEAFIVETVDRGGRYRTYGYRLPPRPPAAVDAEVGRINLLIRSWWLAGNPSTAP